MTKNENKQKEKIDLLTKNLREEKRLVNLITKCFKLFFLMWKGLCNNKYNWLHFYSLIHKYVNYFLDLLFILWWWCGALLFITIILYYIKINKTTIMFGILSNNYS